MTASMLAMRLGTGAVVRQPPEKEPAGDWVEQLCGAMGIWP